MTKYLIFVFLAFFGMSSALSAQFELNISTGLNNSNVKFENLENVITDGKWDFFIGIGPSFRLTDKIRIQIDAQYSLKGYEEEHVNTLSTRFAYLDLIPEMEYEVLDFLALSLGVNYGISLNQQSKLGNDDWGDIPVEIVKSTDFGVVGALKLKYNKLFGFVRYNVGLKNVTDLSFTSRNGDVIDDVKQMNRNLQLGIGYQLGFNNN